MREASKLVHLSSQSTEAAIVQAEEELQKHQEFLALHEAIAKLPIKYQEVITMRYFEKKQLKDIGDILGKNEGTVKTLLRRGLERLRILTEDNETFSHHLGFTIKEVGHERRRN